MYIQFLKTLFYISLIGIIFAMVIYPLSIIILGKIIKHKNPKDYDLIPKVSILIVAHNEEKVILSKLNNVIDLNYPKNKLEIIVSSDNSTDNTDNIVQNFINDHPENNIKLFKTKQRKGKTNAQNEAVRTIDNEFIVFTDANSLFDKNAVKELMASFTETNIAYVTGRLSYIENLDSIANLSETTYWDLDLKVREIESNIQTITAGNGAIYACRTKDYIEIPLIESHDSSFPLYFSIQGKRAIANHAAIAYEKTGESISDEYARKVRMNRILLKFIMPSVKILNIFKMKYYTYFYIGHRTMRYLLWFNHIVLFITSFLLKNMTLYKLIFIGQLLFYILALMKQFNFLNNKLVNFIYYYTVTIVAQIHGIYNIITGKSKPFWEKVESTR